MTTDQVKLHSGSLRGRLAGDVLEFRGVPYAAPPVGSLRFAPPAPVKAWNNLRDATADGPIPPQPPSRVFASMGSSGVNRQSEDCLTLTVWAPHKSADRRLPVVVWLHGGGFASGAGSLPWYDGRRFASRHNIVVVNVNYRLGVLGYLAIPGVLPGNLAILDQEAALRWVQDNIAAFGGDASNVTLIGQSGGGHTIASFLTMPRTRGLFNRAIMQSPPLGIGLQSPPDAMRAATAFLARLDLDAESPDLVDGLRALPVDKLMTAQAEASRAIGRMQEGDLSPPFRPVEGPPHEVKSNAFIESAARAASERNIPVLIGWTREEANLFYAQNEQIAAIDAGGIERVAKRIAGDEAEKLLADVRRRRPDGSQAQWFMDLVSDVAFRLPSMAMADAVIRDGGEAYVYQFDWQSPESGFAACHCLELPFLFGNWEAWADAPLIRSASQAEFDSLSEIMQQRWSAFAAHGSPGFPAWSAERRLVNHIDIEPRTEVA